MLLGQLPQTQVILPNHILPQLGTHLARTAAVPSCGHCLTIPCARGVACVLLEALVEEFIARLGNHVEGIIHDLLRVGALLLLVVLLSDGLRDVIVVVTTLTVVVEIVIYRQS